MAWATPRTWVSGELVTAALLNQHIRDNLNAVVPNGPNGWTAYTPTLTQSVTVTKTVTYAKYMKVGRLVVAQVYLAITSAGTASNNIVIGLPVTAAGPTFLNVGTGWIVNGGLRYKGTVELASTTTVFLRPTNTTTTGVLGGDTLTAALAAGNEINLTATYESAT